MASRLHVIVELTHKGVESSSVESWRSEALT
jgi:hypothetical protein